MTAIREVVAEVLRSLPIATLLLVGAAGFVSLAILALPVGGAP